MIPFVLAADWKCNAAGKCHGLFMFTYSADNGGTYNSGGQGLVRGARPGRRRLRHAKHLLPPSLWRPRVHVIVQPSLWKTTALRTKG